MGDLVSDGTGFQCNLCTAQLKINVIASSAQGDSKKLAADTNFIFPPPPGGQCLLIPNAPAPCAPPKVSVLAHGQSAVEIDGKQALGAGCSLQCAKGGMLSVASSAQSSAQHDGASSAADIAIDVAVVLIDLLNPLRKVKMGITALKYVPKIVKAGAKVAVRGAKKAIKWVRGKKEPAKPSSNESKPSIKGSRGKRGSVDPNLTKDPFNDPKLENKSDARAAEHGHYTFENKETGETVKFDKAKPGGTGHEAYDHYHKVNPNSTSKHDMYLDGSGNPVAKGSDASHVYPPD